MKKMKNKYKLLTLFIVGVIMVNCDNAIDINQPGRLGAEEAFQDVSDLEAGLLGVYREFDTTTEIQFNSVFTDELSIGADNGGQGIGNGEYGFILNPGSDAVQATWVNYNSALNAINRVIEASNLIEPNGSEEQKAYNDVLGQCYALRAYANFQLLSYFSTDYTDENALAGILFDYVPSVDDLLPRNTNGEIYDFIEEDLKNAITLIADQSNPTFVSKDFVTALRARMAIYRNDYPSANNYTTSLLRKYGLADREEYKEMFLDKDNTEIIFKLERTIGDLYDGQGSTGSGFAGGWVGAIYAFVDGTIDGSPYYEIGHSLFRLLDEEDVRYEINVNSTSKIDPDYEAGVTTNDIDILVVGKYFGNEQPLLNDLKVFRSSEMLLIKAEAMAGMQKLNGPSESVAALLKQLRDARYSSPQVLPVFNSEKEAYQAILEERRIELAFEGHRWKDLKRLGVKAEVGIKRDPIDCEINGACSLPADDYRFTMPIPLVELNANPNIEQNPGY